MLRAYQLLGLSMLGVLMAVSLGFGSLFIARGIHRVDLETQNVSSSEQTIEESLPEAWVHVGTLPEAPARRAPVTLFVVGDVMLDRNVAARTRSAHDPAYPFRLVEKDSRFQNADLQVMNLEGPVTDQRRPPQKSIDFLFDPSVVPVLKQVGFDVVSQANNHGHDQGTIGAEDSRARLEKTRFVVFGDEVRNDEVAVATTTVYGRRLAFVGFNSVSAPIRDAVASTTMKFARDHADTVIVYMHWGVEYRDRPSAEQTVRAHWLIDHGADIVIGAHPHWAQGLSVYRGKPIVYSLGNFVFDQDWSRETNQSLAVGVTISDTGVDIVPHPVQITKSQPSFVDGVARQSRLRELAAISDPPLREQILQGIVRFPL